MTVMESNWLWKKKSELNLQKDKRILETSLV